MKDERDELDEKIRKAAFQMKRPEPGPCLDEETLVCYLEGRLNEKERDKVEAHLAACSSCCKQVIAMNRVIHAEEDALPVSEEAIQKAMDLVKKHPLDTLKEAFTSTLESITGMTGKRRFEPGSYGIQACPSPDLSPSSLDIPSARLPEFSEVIIEDGESLSSHDGFQIHFETNRDAYVYVILCSSRGQVKLLFPTSEINMSNKIRGGESYILPSEDSWFPLDKKTGVKAALVLASERPIDDINAFIESLKNKDINTIKFIVPKKANVFKYISFKPFE
ncbi:MAG: DUF4384 domain-containing protein [Candidatus Hodarchaeota archaeon]